MTKWNIALGQTIQAVLSVTLLLISTTLCFIPILFIGVIKLIPNKKLQTLCTKAVDKIATLWIMVNNSYLNATKTTQWEIEGLDNLKRKDWYLVIANHQSWLDIVVLQRAFNRKIPVLKFFIKDQLKWVPLLGFSWWAMGCPFMKRYSAAYIKKNPHKKGKDLLATQKACATFKNLPVSIMNFVEGSRFSQLKKNRQQSPYNNLLKPKAGGMAYVLNTMGQQINSILDVTIIYPNKHRTLWDFLCHRIDKIKVIVRTVPIPTQFLKGNYFEDNKLQQDFRNWLNNYWQQKDKLIESHS